MSRHTSRARCSLTEMMPVPQTFWRTEHTDLSEEMSEMANKDEYLNAAKKAPSQRSTREQQLVDRGLSFGMLDVKNADHDAKRHEKNFGR